MTRPRGGGEVKQISKRKNKMIGEKKPKQRLKKDRITYVDETTTRAMVVVRAKVRERRQAQRQAGKQDKRRAKSKKKNRYVIKVMNEHREGEQFLKFARTKAKGCSPPFHWLVLI